MARVDEQFGRFPHEAADGPTEGLVHFLYVEIGALREVGIWLPDVPTLA